MITNKSLVQDIIRKELFHNLNFEYDRVVFMKIKYTNHGNPLSEFIIPIAYKDENSNEIIKNFFGYQYGRFIGYGRDEYQIETGSFANDAEAFEKFRQDLENSDPDSNFMAFSVQNLQNLLAQEGYVFDSSNYTLTSTQSMPQISIPSQNTDSLGDSRAKGTNYATLCQNLYIDEPTHSGRYFCRDVDNSNFPLVYFHYAKPVSGLSGNAISPTDTETGLRLYMTLNIDQFDQIFPDVLGDLNSFNQRDITVNYGYLPQKACSNPSEVLLLNYFWNNGYVSDFKIPVKQTSDDSIMQLPTYLANSRYYVLDNVNLDNSLLLNGQNYKDGQSVWFEVMPVEWCCHYDSNTMRIDLFTKDVVLAGTPYHTTSPAPSNFKDTTLYEFLSIVGDFLYKSNDMLKQPNSQDLLTCANRTTKYFENSILFDQIITALQKNDSIDYIISNSNLSNSSEDSSYDFLNFFLYKIKESGKYDEQVMSHVDAFLNGTVDFSNLCDKLWKEPNSSSKQEFDSSSCQTEKNCSKNPNLEEMLKALFEFTSPNNSIPEDSFEFCMFLSALGLIKNEKESFYVVQVNQEQPNYILLYKDPDRMVADPHQKSCKPIGNYSDNKNTHAHFFIDKSTIEPRTAPKHQKSFPSSVLHKI